MGSKSPCPQGAPKAICICPNTLRNCREGRTQIWMAVYRRTSHHPTLSQAGQKCTDSAPGAQATFTVKKREAKLSLQRRHLGFSVLVLWLIVLKVYLVLVFDMPVLWMLLSASRDSLLVTTASREMLERYVSPSLVHIPS